ncbi:MAG: histone H1 [Candidatus Kryptonium sp.]|nr:histone H1 [Candidatus Kryptonium sp.]MCX7763214.1 histone H1 [Candidatus Kryptonium sp.]MDW8109172.1 histone H1 [Candidatus Kryptonium sp.]
MHHRFQQLREFIDSLEDDFRKFYEKGVMSAGTRLRKKMQELRKLAQEIRVEIQQIKQEKKGAKKEEKSE